MKDWYNNHIAKLIGKWRAWTFAKKTKWIQRLAKFLTWFAETRIVAGYLKRRNDRVLDGIEIDVNAKCPICGHRNGELGVKWGLGKTESGSIRMPFVEHTCKICKGKFYEPPLVKPERWVDLIGPQQ